MVAIWVLSGRRPCARQQCRMVFFLTEIVHGAVHTLLALTGAIQQGGTAIRVTGGTKSLIVQSSYEES